MSWHAPTTYAEIAASIRQGWSWTSKRHGLRGESIQVLSSKARPSLDLDDSEFSNVIKAHAAKRTDRYLTDGTRKPAPGDCVYFVADLKGRVLAAVTAGGPIIWEVGGNRVYQRDDLYAALEALATRVRGKSDW